MLDPGGTSVADGGDRVNTARRPIVGAQTVAQYLLGVMEAQRKPLIDPQLSRETMNGHSGVAIRDHGRLVGTSDLAVTNGRIAGIAIQVNEDNLQGKRHLRRSLVKPFVGSPARHSAQDTAQF